jgi:hypothetical protein
MLLSQDAAKEVLPNLWTAEKLDWQGKAIGVGMTRRQAVDALGEKFKVFSKARAISDREMLKQREMALRIAPWEAPMIEYVDRLIKECGAKCWMEALEWKIAKKEKVQLTMLGPNSEELHVAMIVVDRGHSFTRDAMAGGLNARYVVTDDQVYRISQIGPTIRIEKLK